MDSRENKEIIGERRNMPGGVSPDVPSEAAMTKEQYGILEDLCDKTGEPFDSTLTEAQAAERIEHLRAKL